MVKISLCDISTQQNDTFALVNTCHFVIGTCQNDTCYFGTLACVILARVILLCQCIAQRNLNQVLAFPTSQNSPLQSWGTDTFSSAILTRIAYKRWPWLGPLLKTGQIEFLLPNDAQYSETYAKTVLHFFLIRSFKKISSLNFWILEIFRQNNFRRKI